MNRTNYWLSPTTDDDYDHCYEAYRVVGEQMKDNFGIVFVTEEKEEYTVMIERYDIGRKEFRSTHDEKEVSILTKLAASSLYRA